MKKKSLIVGGIAAFAAIASIGTSFALYKVAPENKEVDIGIRTGTDINYAISEVTGAEGNGLITPDHLTNTYNFNIQGKKAEGTTYTQPYILAKLTVTVTSENTALIDAMAASATIGYKEGTYFANTESMNTLTLAEPVDGDGTTLTGSLSTYIYVGDGFTVAPGEGVATHNPVELSIGLASKPTDTEFLALAGDYSVSITLADDESYQVAHVVGTMTGWEKSDQYEMVMNIEKEDTPAESDLEWMWLGSIEAGNQIKAKHENGTWSADPNLSVPENLTGVYWTGNGTDRINTSTSN